MTEETQNNTKQTFLDDQERKSRFDNAFAEIKADLEQIESDLDDCQRLTEEDFAIRIDARG